MPQITWVQGYKPVISRGFQRGNARLWTVTIKFATASATATAVYKASKPITLDELIPSVEVFAETFALEHDEQIIKQSFIAVSR